MRPINVNLKHQIEQQRQSKYKSTTPGGTSQPDPRHLVEAKTGNMSDQDRKLHEEQLLRTLRRGKQRDVLGEKIEHALQLITTMLDDLGWVELCLTVSGGLLIDDSEDHVAISFNGGKDCRSLV